MGNNKKPIEAECDLPFNVSNPQLGDVKRNEGHITEYTAYCKFNGVVKSYEIDESTFTDLLAGDNITCKKFRFGSSVCGIEIEEKE